MKPPFPSQTHPSVEITPTPVDSPDFSHAESEFHTNAPSGKLDFGLWDLDSAAGCAPSPLPASLHLPASFRVATRWQSTRPIPSFPVPSLSRARR
ncbi:MAG: hypothetical protein ABIS50_11190 [Luteolibacter sp.]